jgi:hypothetical protein
MTGQAGECAHAHKKETPATGKERNTEMSAGRDNHGEFGPGKGRPGLGRPGKQAGNSPESLKGPHIISYNLREEERPGGPDGLKVRWKWRVETGKKAEALDARQAEAIRKALQWIHDHKHPAS